MAMAGTWQPRPTRALSSRVLPSSPSWVWVTPTSKLRTRLSFRKALGAEV